MTFKEQGEGFFLGTASLEVPDIKRGDLEQTLKKSSLVSILGDLGSVSRVRRKGGTKVFKYEQKSPWVPTLTELFPKIQADAGS